MVAAAGNSSATVKSSPSRRKKRRSERNLLLNDQLLSRLSSAAAVTHSFLETNDLFLPPHHSLRISSLLSSLPISPPPPSTSTSTSSWFHRFVNSAVDEDDPRWRICFRMPKRTFFNLHSILSSSSSLPASSLAATIFRLAHNASYESLLVRFGFDSVSDASRAFYTVCKLVNDKLGLLIDDPKPDYSPPRLGVLGFERFSVDCELLGSLVAQALVDSTGRFVDISVGWPNSMEPEAIFRQSKIFSESRCFLEGPQYILGDYCLPSLPWLVTEGEEFDNVGVEMELPSVEDVFAKVRARWRILDRNWKLETMEFLPFLVTTCCLLHNYLVDEQVDGAAGAAGAEIRKDEEETRRSDGEVFMEL